MALTIGYDRPVTNYIPELSKTGHVTHESYKKTSVTFHHNAGNLTHAGMLTTWRTRAASAHFDVDAKGAVAQFVKVNEYAWAVGNAAGNRSSISIEMANSSFAPDWEVSDTTWESAARLAGWLFAHEIKAKPTKDNVFYHHHWSATACAGPYMDSIYSKVLKAVQAAYNEFVKGDDEPKPSTPVKKSVAAVASEVIAGKWGNDPERSRLLKSKGYNPNEVQIEVNRQLSHSKPTSPRKTVSQIAHEVIDGKWGNGVDRTTRLTKAGYNSDTVQKEVNRLLR